jgi:hypothetical protein
MSETTFPAVSLGSTLNMLGAAMKEKKNMLPTQSEIESV